MGREVRRVPANWEHPKYTETTAHNQELVGKYIPLKDNYDKALNDFEKDINEKGLGKAIDYWGGGPQSEEYVQYGNQPADWWQLYETVSEGTPVSPAFKTPEELIDYLVNNGDLWDQRRRLENGSGKRGYSIDAAKALVVGGWAPSGVVVGGIFYEGAEGLLV